MTQERQHERIALAFQVEYRTAGAFLVAFSSNLSAGGLFVETTQPLAVGQAVSLQLTIPGSGPIPVQGVVVWSRPQPSEGKPAGMGIRFSEPLDVQHGEAIDRIVAAFRGLHIVVLAGSNAARMLLVRAVRSTISAATVHEATDADSASKALEKDIDLLVIDLDDAGADGLTALKQARSAPNPIPVLVTSAFDTSRSHAHELGASETLGNPPAVPDLQAAVVRALAQPARIG